MDHIMSYEEYLRDVKKGIVTDLGNCPVTPLLVMLQGKWKTQILYELCIHDTVRFGTLKKELPGITNTMLTSFLRELEQDGPSTGYSTTRSRPAWNILHPARQGSDADFL
ncbi:MAG: winged helix-turn-helix transcriptional regulator [Blautia massiliensis (ex Durand et al. 2017)]